jgi:site-specific recombinase XerD
VIRDHERAVAAYVANAKGRNLAPSTVERNLETIRRFLASLGRRRVASARKEDVRRFLAARSRRTKLLDQELGIVRSLLRVLFPDAEALPTDGFKVKRAPPGPRLFLSRDAVKEILRVALQPELRGRGLKKLRLPLALRDRALVELLYGLGLRASEASATRLTDLDLDAGTLLVRRAKRGTSRVMPLPKPAVPHVARYVREGRPALLKEGIDDEGALLLSFRGFALSTSGLSGLVARLGRLAGVRAHPHAFRRGVATDLFHGGAMAVGVQDFLGHESLQTTAIYVAVDREHLRKAVEFLERPQGQK